jgi:hypothetical protein
VLSNPDDTRVWDGSTCFQGRLTEPSDATRSITDIPFTEYRTVRIFSSYHTHEDALEFRWAQKVIVPLLNLTESRQLRVVLKSVMQEASLGPQIL